MSDPKYIYRVVPCPVYRVEKFQSWLEDLAREGLILEKDTFFLGIATFTRQAPQNLRYRLEPTPKQAGSMNEYDTPDYRAVELNEAFGWEYLCRYGQFYLYRCANPHAPELHTDPQLQQINLKALKKRTRSALLGSVLNLFFMGWLSLGFILTICCAFLGTPLVAWGLVMALESFISRSTEVLHLRKLCHRLKNGESITKSVPWKEGALFFRVRSALSVLLPLLWLLAMFSTKADGQYLVEDYPQPLPFATLADIFPESEVTLDDSFVDSKVLLYSDILIPETIEYTFHGDIRSGTYETNYAIVHVNYHRTISPFFAQQLVREYQRHAARQNSLFSQSRRIPYDMSSVDADAVVCYNEGINVVLILCKGNEMVRCTYLNQGHDTDPEIEYFAEKMADSLG